MCNTELSFRILIFLHVEPVFNSFVTHVLLIVTRKLNINKKAYELLQVYVEHDENSAEEDIGRLHSLVDSTPAVVFQNSKQGSYGKDVINDPVHHHISLD